MELFGKDKELNVTKLESPFSSQTEKEKEELSLKLEEYKEKLSSQWADVKDDVISKGKHTAIVGGAVLGVYLLMETILPKADDTPVRIPKPSKPSVDPLPVKKAGMDIAGALQSIVWAAAMGWAKQKVTEFVVAERNSNVKKNG